MPEINEIIANIEEQHLRHMARKVNREKNFNFKEAQKNYVRRQEKHRNQMQRLEE